jgi:hypothetical protein
MTMKHVIRKQVVALNIQAGQDQFRIQQRASDYFNMHIMPVLEKLFDEMSDPSHVLILDKIQLDLGDLGWQNDAFKMDENTLYQRLKAELTRALGNMRGPEQITGSGINRVPTGEHVCMQWLNYLEQGFLPWGIDRTRDEWLGRVLETLAVDHVMITRIRNSLITDKWMLRRMVKDHDQFFLVNLAEVLTAGSQKDLVGKIELWASEKNKDEGNTDSNVQFRKLYYWEAILREFAAGKKIIENPEELSMGSEKTKGQPPMDASSNLNMEDGIYCSNAGLVLLHPFYKSLFKHTRQLQEDSFTSRQEQEKAVMMLYFIATGKTRPEEYELVIPKILCGIPLRESLGYESSWLSDDNKAEAENMMKAAIAQWSILKNTSIDGLREGFLQRSGKLYEKENSLLLTIESSGIDVLLDRLPWNLNIIKFPWLKALIRVEWR